MINLNKNHSSSPFLNFWALMLVLLFVSISCKQKRTLYKSPPGYDFSAMIETTDLDPKLKEISGLAWDPALNHFLAIHDERGDLFILDKETKAIRKPYDFGTKKDYEDIAVVNSVPYVLVSDGTIIKLNIDSSGSISTTNMGTIPIEGTRDFESLYYDPYRKALVMLCKNCDIDDKKTVSAFAYYIDSAGFDKTPLYQIDVEAADKLSPKNSSRIEPSGAAIHPLQRKLYILSSASNQLLVTDLDGKVEQVFFLMSELFKQPEGICIKQNGDMYISNEGVTGSATLIKCTYRREKKTAGADTTGSIDTFSTKDTINIGNQ